MKRTGILFQIVASLALAALLVGVVVGLQLLAAWFAPLDFAWRGERYWGRIVMRVAGWTLVFGLLWWLTPVAWEAAYFTGLRFSLYFTVIQMLAVTLLPMVAARAERGEYQRFLEGRED